eukprot:468343-Alexandrium_andersonii.AAC.1
MIDEAASGSAFRMVAGETLKGAKQTALTPRGEVQSWALLESPVESSVSSRWSSSLMSFTPLP